MISICTLTQQPSHELDEGIELGVAQGGEEGPLHSVLLPVCRREPRLALGREPDGDQASVVGLAMPLDQSVAFKGVEHARDGGSRETGEAGDLARRQLHAGRRV